MEGSDGDLDARDQPDLLEDGFEQLSDQALAQTVACEAGDTIFLLPI